MNDRTTPRAAPDSARNTARLLTTVIVLQGLTLLGQWTGQPRGTSDARADLPDPAARQLQMLEELRGINHRLDKVVSVLESGKLRVTVEAAPEEE